MKRYWVRWHTTEPLDEFEYHGPWWLSGTAGFEEPIDICVAAVQAESIDEAQAVIINAYDAQPAPRHVVFDFTNERADDWSPFCDRFPRADWMTWPYPTRPLKREGGER